MSFFAWTFLNFLARCEKWGKNAIKIVFKISGLRKYLCHLCDKTFQNSRQLKDHIQVVHEGIKYGCERCDKSFNSLNRMRDHIKFTHEGIKNYSCEKCGKSFFTKDYLKIHNETVHEGKKLWECDICHASYTRHTGYKNHMNR